MSIMTSTTTMSTIDYKALAERINEYRRMYENLHSMTGEPTPPIVIDLRTLASLLEGMAEEKPAMWAQSNHVSWAGKQPFMVRCAPTQLQPDYVPLFTHPAPQPQPDFAPDPYPDEPKWEAPVEPTDAQIDTGEQPERQPTSEPTEQVTCGCGDEYPATSFEAGYICAVGHCSKCDAKPSSEPFDNADDLIAHLHAQCEPTDAQYVYVRLTRPEDYEDVHPDLVLEDAGIKAVFEPEVVAHTITRSVTHEPVEPTEAQIHERHVAKAYALCPSELTTPARYRWMANYLNDTLRAALAAKEK